MSIHDVELRFWELQRSGSLSLQEVGFLVFLIGQLRRNQVGDNILRWSDSRLCRQLSISRNQLRKLRTRLMDVGLLAVQTIVGKGGGTLYQLFPRETVQEPILSPVETVTEVVLSAIDTVRPILFPVETVTGGILYSTETVSRDVLYSAGTVTGVLCVSPRPCSPLSPSSSPLHPSSSPPISPSNPPPLREAEGERGERPARSQGKETHPWIAEGTECSEEPTLQEVVDYFEVEGFLNPQREGQKFWLMRYWLHRPKMHWHGAASLWNDRAVAYQEQHNAPYRATHSSSRSRDEKQKQSRELVRAHIAAVRSQAGL